MTNQKKPTVEEWVEWAQKVTDTQPDTTTDQTTDEPQCQECGEEYPLARYQLKHINYKFCKGCADKLPSPTRTIVPMHKSNYMMITDMDDLKGINNKGGLHR